MAEQQAAAAQRALEEQRARELEAQAKVAQEWERQQMEQRRRQVEEAARAEAERNNLLQVQQKSICYHESTHEVTCSKRSRSIIIHMQ